MGTPRPFRAAVYLPAQEGERAVKVKSLSASTEVGLNDLAAPWVADGFRVKRYEVLVLPLEDTADDQA